MSLEEVVQNVEEINAELQRRLAQADEVAEVLRQEIQVLLMRNGKLRAERERELGESVEAVVVTDLIEFWKAETGHERATVSVSGKRGDYVRKAMRMGYSHDQIRDVFRVAGRFPYVDPSRSSHPSGRCPSGDVLRDDIPTLLKDEVTIDRLLDLKNVHALRFEPGSPGAQPTEVADDDLRVVDRWRQANYPLALVTAALWEYSSDFDLSDPDHYTAKCPVHFGPGLIVRRSDDGLISVECERGCEFWRLLAALHLEPSDLFENAEHDPTRRNADVERDRPVHLTEAAGLLAARLSGVASS